MPSQGDTSQQDDLHQEQSAAYRCFDLRGSHYTIGYEMGRAAPMRIVRSWRDQGEELSFAAACLGEVARLHPDLPKEVWGYAAGQGRSQDEVLSHFSLNLPEGRLSGCTTLAVRLTDGHVLVARNYDFLHSQKQRYLRRLSPSRYPASLGTQAGLIGSCYDGVSSRGLFVALHLIHAQIAESVPPGVPYHLIPRILLETCASAVEAVDLLIGIPHLFAFNYLVADSRDILAVEAYPGRVRVREPREGCLVVTNYFAHADMRPLQGRRRHDAQQKRVRWIRSQVNSRCPATAGNAWSWAHSLLRDHSVPVCHHRPTQATLWAMTADLTARRVAYCLGAPCRNEFLERDWPMCEGSSHA